MKCSPSEAIFEGFVFPYRCETKLVIRLLPDHYFYLLLAIQLLMFLNPRPSFPPSPLFTRTLVPPVPF